MKRIPPLITALAFFLGVTMALHANATSLGDVTSFYNADVSEVEEHGPGVRGTLYNSEEAETLKDWILINEAWESNPQALHILYHWAVHNAGDNPESATVCLTIVQENSDIPHMVSGAAANRVIQLGEVDNAENWFQEGVISSPSAIWPIVRRYPGLEDVAYLSILAGTGNMSPRYKEWLIRRYLPRLSDQEAVDFLRNELRVMISIPESDERNEWIQKLRTTLTIRKDLL